MRAPTFRPVGLALPFAFLLSACGDDGGPGTDPCAVATAYTIGSTVNGTLSSSDCDFGDGTFIDQYRLEAATQVSARFSMSSGAFDAFLWIFATGSPGGQILALQDNIDAGTTNSSIHILMAPDSYIVGANSAIIGQADTGPYTLTSTIVPSSNTDCAEVWVTPGVTTSQTLATFDCQDAGFSSDEFLIVLLFGQTLTVTMASSDVNLNPHLVLENADGAFLTEDTGDAMDAMIVYTPPEATFPVYIIVATSDAPSEVGAYTLTIQVAD